MLNQLAKEIYDDAVAHGWYDVDDMPGFIADRNFGEVIALCHSELSEALEEWRKGQAHGYTYYRESDGKPEGTAVEMADTLIRILDWFAANDIDADAVVREKMNFNKSRPYKHGGKIA